jgi:hypothetical protein
MNIVKGSIDMIEFAWIEIEIDHDGEIYTLEFETEERPSKGTFSSVEFASDESEDIANQIGFEITDDFMAELYHRWNDYSNEHFRG